MYYTQLPINLFDRTHFLKFRGFLAKTFQLISQKIWWYFQASQANTPSPAARPPVCCMHLFITIVTERQTKNNIKKSKSGIKSMKRHLVIVWIFSDKDKPDEVGLGGAEMGHFKTGS